MPSCRHGDFSQRSGDLSTSEDRRAVAHEKKCRSGGGVFGHPGTWLGIFRVLCCAGCGKQVS